MEELYEVCIWPDGTWCYKVELYQYTHMSDDYVVELLSEDELMQLEEGEIIL